MKQFKIGVRLESLGLPLRRALAEAARMGATGVQVDALGDLSPNNLSQSGRREFRTLLRTFDLELTAVGCPLRRGLDTGEDQEPRLDHVRKVMTLACDLGPKCVVVEAGKVPDKEEEHRARFLRDSLTNLGGHGDRIGARLALETGLESGQALATYLASFNSGSLAVNLDPANLMVNGFDPLASTRELRGLIAHTHARDIRMGSAGRGAVEVPLGHGHIDWLSYLETLEEIEYRGWLTLEREGVASRLADLQSGIAFLRNLGV